MKKLTLILCALLGLGEVHAAVSFATQPYLQNLTPTSVTIMWVTEGSEQLTGWVEYGINTCDQQAYEYTPGMRQAFNHINRVSIDHLTPGTTYQYKVRIREIMSVKNTSLKWGETYSTQVYTFTTPELKAKEVSCLAFDDLHGNPNYLDSLLKVNKVDVRHQDFVFLNGDILNAVPSKEEVINNMLAPFSKSFASEVPFFSTRGNHEYRNKFARRLGEYIGNDYYYSFTWGPCFFIVLDTGEDKADTCVSYNGLLDSERYRLMQADWLREQLQSKACKQAKYTVVFMHIPFYSNTSTARFAVQDCRDKFMPLMNKYKVDAVICGHTHKAGVIEANQDHHFPIVIGGGKDTTDEKRIYCPAMVQLHADMKALDIQLLDYYGENRGKVHISK